MSDESFCVVEFNYYHGVDSKFVVKELALRAPQTAQQQLWTFRAPGSENDLSPMTKFKNLKLKETDVQFEWMDGDLPQSDLFKVLSNTTKKFSHVIVHGLKKAHFISNLLKRQVLDMEPAYSLCEQNGEIVALVFETMCMYHKLENRHKCALTKCLKYGSFMMQHKCELIPAKTFVKYV
jgi:hypothetical protein